MTGPGTRPMVLEGAFLGELAKIWARLGGPGGGDTVSCSNTWLQRCCGRCCYLIGHSEVRQAQLPGRTPEKRQVRQAGWPTPRVPQHPASGCGSSPAPPQGSWGSTCQMAASWGRAAQQSSGASLPCEDRAHPAAPEKVQQDGTEASVPGEGVWMSCSWSDSSARPRILRAGWK